MAEKIEMPQAPTIELSVCIFNLQYTVRGFNAIRELKEFLDEHAICGTAQPYFGDQDAAYPQQANSGNGQIDAVGSPG